MAIEPGTQVGADGDRWPVGTAPLTASVRNTPNRLSAIESSLALVYQQPQTDLLAGNGFSDDGTVVGAGFIIPESWQTYTATMYWGLFGSPTDAGDASFCLLAAFTDVGENLGSPSFVDAVTVPEAEIPGGKFLEVVLAEDEPVTGKLMSFRFGRVKTLLGGSYDDVLQPYDDADTATYADGQGGVFAIAFTPSNIVGG